MNREDEDRYGRPEDLPTAPPPPTVVPPPPTPAQGPPPPPIATPPLATRASSKRTSRLTLLALTTPVRCVTCTAVQRISLLSFRRLSIRTGEEILTAQNFIRELPELTFNKAVGAIGPSGFCALFRHTATCILPPRSAGEEITLNGIGARKSREKCYVMMDMKVEDKKGMVLLTVVRCSSLHITVLCNCAHATALDCAMCHCPSLTTTGR